MSFSGSKDAILRSKDVLLQALFCKIFDNKRSHFLGSKKSYCGSKDVIVGI